MDGISWEGGEANPVQSSIDVPASPKKKNNEMKMPWKEKNGGCHSKIKTLSKVKRQKKKRKKAEMTPFYFIK